MFDDQENVVRIKRGGGGGNKEKEEKKEAGGEEEVQSRGAQPSSVAEEMEFVRLFMTLNEDERSLIGHNITQFIKACTFRGRSCNISTLV